MVIEGSHAQTERKDSDDDAKGKANPRNMEEAVPCRCWKMGDVFDERQREPQCSTRHRQQILVKAISGTLNVLPRLPSVFVVKGLSALVIVLGHSSLLSSVNSDFS